MTGPELSPVLLSLAVSGIASLIVVPAGLLLAHLLSRARRPWQPLLDALVLLPLVLPPSVLGYLLILFLGRRGLLGAWLAEAIGVTLIFTPAGAVAAAAIVALPLFALTARAALDAVPRELQDVAATLGLPPAAVFLRITLPLAWRGVTAGAVLAFARALGEFGATLMFAGAIPGRTETMPLAIYTAWQTGDDRAALAYTGILALCSLGIALGASWLVPRSPEAG